MLARLGREDVRFSLTVVPTVLMGLIPKSYGEGLCQVAPQGSVMSSSMPSGVVKEGFRDRGFWAASPTRVCDELGVGSGEPDGVRLGPAMRESRERSGIDVVPIGGKEGEKTDGGRAAGRSWERGIR